MITTLYKTAMSSSATIAKNPKDHKHEMTLDDYLLSCQNNTLDHFKHYIPKFNGTERIKRWDRADKKYKTVRCIEGDLKGYTAFLRALTDKKEYKYYKTLLSQPVMVSMTSKSGHKLSEMTSKTGVILMDIDDLKKEEVKLLKNKLKDDPKVKAVQESLSGLGLAVYYLYDAETYDHFDIYKALERDLSNSYGVTVDKSCKDLTRLRFSAYDDKMHIKKTEDVELVTGTYKSCDTIGDVIVMRNKDVVDGMIEMMDFREESFGSTGWLTGLVANVHKKDKPAVGLRLIKKINNDILSNRGDSTPYEDYKKRYMDFRKTEKHDVVGERIIRLKTLAVGQCGSTMINKLFREIEDSSIDQIQEIGKITHIYDSLSELLENVKVLDETYYINVGECFVTKTWNSLKAHFAVFNPFTSDFANNIIKAQLDLNNRVDVAGGFVGKEIGVETLQDSGKKYLVTSSRNMKYAPKEGEWKNIQRFIESFLNYDEEQITFFYSYLKVFLTTLDKHRLDYAQALVILGPRNTGKTLLLRLIGLLTGYQQTDPTEIFLDSRAFNGEFPDCAMFVMDDANTPPKLTHIVVAKAIKALLFAGSTRINTKFVTKKINLSFPKRVMICANTDVDDLKAVPRKYALGEDKVCYLWTQPSILPKSDVYSNNKILDPELPAFHNYLLNEHVIPDDLIDARTGVKSYAHPIALEKLDDHLSQEEVLIEYISEYIFKDELNDEVDLTATGIFTKLKPYWNNAYKNPTILSHVIKRLMGDKQLQIQFNINITRPSKKYLFKRIKKEELTPTPTVSILQETLEKFGILSQEKFETLDNELNEFEKSDHNSICQAIEAKLW